MAADIKYMGWVDIAPPEGNYFLFSAAAANWEIK